MKSVCLILSLVLSSCGLNKNGQASQRTYPASKLTGKSAQGLAYTTRSTLGTTVYFWDFESGLSTEILNSASKDIGIFPAGNHQFLIADRGNGSFKIANISGTEVSLSESSVTIPYAEPGDPADILLASNNDILIAHRFGKRIIVSDDLALTKVTALEGPDDTFAPVAFAQSSSATWILNSGVDDNMQPIGTQKVLRLSSGSMTEPSDLVPSASAPLGFISAGDERWIICGLCNETLGSQCHAGVDFFDGKSGTLTKTSWNLDATGLRLKGFIVEGPDEDSVYAHTEINGKYAVHILDITQRTISELYAFEDSSDDHYLLSANQKDELLIIGEQETQGGTMNIFEKNELVSTFKTSEIPTFGIFIP